MVKFYYKNRPFDVVKIRRHPVTGQPLYVMVIAPEGHRIFSVHDGKLVKTRRIGETDNMLKFDDTIVK